MVPAIMPGSFFPAGKNRYRMTAGKYNSSMASINEALYRLSRSRFRSSFHLKEKDIAYIRDKGMDTVRRHACDFVAQKLAPAVPENDGKQTPMKGHPVFIAMHATGTCCRGCLMKWYRVPQGIPLSDIQQEKIVNLIMAWIMREYGKQTGEPVYENTETI